MDSYLGPSNMRIIIVGGSISGLFTGIVLSNLPRVESVIVLEKSEEYQQKDQGAGIRLSDEVLNSITKYTGIRPEEYCVPTHFMKQFDENGKVLLSRDVLMWACSWTSLFRILKRKFGQLGKSRYRNGCTVVNMVDKNQTVQVHLTNETGQQETAEAELVIGADGISSTVRQLLLPECARIYAGYTIVRGLLPPSELSSDLLAIFDDTGTTGFTRDSQTLSYLVPGGNAPSDDSQTGRLLNWAWYRVYSDEELENIMTDSSGLRRKFTAPQGTLREEVVDEIRAAARKELPKVFLDVVEKTKQPFLQAVTDSMASNNVFLNRKVILIGDALAGQRPHTASGCTQSTFHTLLLESYLREDLSIERMSEQAQEFSKILVDAGKKLGSIILSTRLTPAEKARDYFIAWRTAQIELGKRYKSMTS